MRFRQFKLNQITESLLGEVAMSPSSLTAWANSSAADGMLMGIEFEMGVPPLKASEEPVPNMSDDRTAYMIMDLADFYFYNSDYDAYRLHRDQLREKYKQWVNDELEYIETGEAYETEVIDHAKGYITASIVNDAADRYQREIDAGATPNDDRYKEIKTELINNIWYDENNPNRKRAFDRAVRHIREIIIDKKLSQKNWLNSVMGIEKYSDAVNVLGWKWPHYVKSGSSISEIADHFKNALGLSKVNYSERYHGATREDGIWSIETDSSIKTTDSDHRGLEFISPAQPIAKTLEEMKKLHKWANDNGCYTNSSTGLHMNISVPDFSMQKLDYIKLAIFSGDDYVLKQFGRIGNEFCDSATRIIKRNAANATQEDITQFLEKMRESMNTVASKLIHSGKTVKYTSINTKEGYVEFRGPGGNYLSMQPEQLVLTSLRLAMALSIACDENAYTKEYTTKLYKLIAPQDSNNNTVSLFSRYSTGQLNTRELIYHLKQFQANRAAKKRVVAKRKARLAGGLDRYKVSSSHSGALVDYFNAATEEDAIKQAMQVYSYAGLVPRSPSEFTAELVQ